MFACKPSIGTEFGQHWHMTKDESDQCILVMRLETAQRRAGHSSPVLAPQPATRPVVPMATTVPAPANVAPATPRYARSVSWRDDPSTPAQWRKVAAMGGDENKAQGITKGECSDYIDALDRGEVDTEDPNQFKSQQADEGLVQLLLNIKDGYYAARQDDESPVIFFKVTRPNSGNYKGAFKVMTQHSEQWKLAYCYWPSKRETVVRSDIKELMLLVMANMPKAAAFYAFEKNRCQICGKELTDDRSRYYGIGPDCGPRHPVVIEDIDYRFGPWEMGKLRKTFSW
jgi:hypothetical protein